MSDLPPPGHLLDHQLGIHRHRDLGSVQLGRLLQTGYQAAIFGDVVSRMADRLLALGQHSRPVRCPDHRPVACRPWVTARPAVGFDNHFQHHY